MVSKSRADDTGEKRQFRLHILRGNGKKESPIYAVLAESKEIYTSSKSKKESKKYARVANRDYEIYDHCDIFISYN